MSFGVIFSLILIAVFIFVAFFAIRAFLDINECADEGTIIRDLENEVDRIWKSSQGENNYKFERRIDERIEYVCFFDFQRPLEGNFRDIGEELKRFNVVGNNLYFYPVRDSCTESVAIDNINMADLPMNPYCLNNQEGFVEMRLSKDIGESLVRVR